MSLRSLWIFGAAALNVAGAYYLGFEIYGAFLRALPQWADRDVGGYPLRAIASVLIVTVLLFVVAWLVASHWRGTAARLGLAVWPCYYVIDRLFFFEPLVRCRLAMSFSQHCGYGYLATAIPVLAVLAGAWLARRRPANFLRDA